MDISQNCMAPHLPMMTAYPGARLLRLSKYKLETVTVETDGSLQGHAQILRRPAQFIEAAIEE
jgi:predicted ATPase